MSDPSQISIHSPHARGDQRRSRGHADGAGISIRSPHARGDGRKRCKRCSIQISIHSPHTRGDKQEDGILTWEITFQSTPLTRGETSAGEQIAGSDSISIHSPHARGDYSYLCLYRQYRAYKQAAGDFRARIAANSGRFPHPAAMDEGVAAMLPELVWTLTPLELARLTAQVIANAPASEVSIHQLHVPLVDLRAQSLVVRDRLIAALESKGDQSISFSELTRDCTSRIEVVARFMAVLVFFKQGVLQYQQDGPFAELHLRWVPGVAETMSDVNISEGDFA